MPRGLGTGGGMPGQAETLRDACADDRRPIADHKQAIDRTGGGGLQDRRHRRVLVVEPNRNRGVPPRILDQMTPIGREDELRANPVRRVSKRTRLVAGRRR